MPIYKRTKDNLAFAAGNQKEEEDQRIALIKQIWAIVLEAVNCVLELLVFLAYVFLCNHLFDLSICKVSGYEE